MDSSQQQDLFSLLPEDILIAIISFLPFKQRVQTNVLSSRWRDLFYNIKNLSFKETEYVSSSITDEFSRFLARIFFFLFIHKWVSKIHDKPVESFELCFSNPVGFSNLIESLINFSVSKRVKKLVIDLSNPAPRKRSYCDVRYGHFEFTLPESVYTLTTLESLEIYGCNFDPSRFTNPVLLRNLSIGGIRIGLEFLNDFLFRSHSLMSLTFRHCVFTTPTIALISAHVRELVVEDCDFLYNQCSFELQNIHSLKYTGKLFEFYFDRMNVIIEEVRLDFGAENQYNGQPNEVDSRVLSRCLNELRARTLGVCPYLLEVIPGCDDPDFMIQPVLETQHLVVRTKMLAKEFNGIKILLQNCFNLVTLTFDILPAKPHLRTLSYNGVDPKTYWIENITYNCLRETLKLVVVRNFGGSSNELNMLRHLLQSGGVLERVELYLPSGMEESQAMEVLARAEMLQRATKHVKVLCMYNA